MHERVTSAWCERQSSMPNARKMLSSEAEELEKASSRGALPGVCGARRRTGHQHFAQGRAHVDRQHRLVEAAILLLYEGSWGLKAYIYWDPLTPLHQTPRSPQSAILS